MPIPPIAYALAAAAVAALVWFLRKGSGGPVLPDDRWVDRGEGAPPPKGAPPPVAPPTSPPGSPPIAVAPGTVGTRDKLGFGSLPAYQTVKPSGKTAGKARTFVPKRRRTALAYDPTTLRLWGEVVAALAGRVPPWEGLDDALKVRFDTAVKSHYLPSQDARKTEAERASLTAAYQAERAAVVAAASGLPAPTRGSPEETALTEVIKSGPDAAKKLGSLFGGGGGSTTPPERQSDAEFLVGLLQTAGHLWVAGPEAVRNFLVAQGSATTEAINIVLVALNTPRTTYGTARAEETANHALDMWRAGGMPAVRR